MALAVPAYDIVGLVGARYCIWRTGGWITPVRFTSDYKGGSAWQKTSQG